MLTCLHSRHPPLATFQGLAGLFTSLVKQQGPDARRHLETFVRRAAEVMPVSDLLSGLFGLPPEAAPGPEVQVCAPAPARCAC